MGDARKRSAVTDTEGRVHGAHGLRVVDASLMPRLPSANTNIPTIMIADAMLGKTQFAAQDQRGLARLTS
jgi:5-(hydroxymethyl)furfural/furfural oxidase